MHGPIGAHGKSGIFPMAITEFAARFEPTAPLKGRVDQPVSRKSRETGLERESEPAAGMAPPKILGF
jgi:hypothetical protein